MSRYQRFYCRNCEASRRFRKPAPKHQLHATLTVCTLGLWSPVWLAQTLKHARRRWRCTLCRHPLSLGAEEPSLAAAQMADAWAGEGKAHDSPSIATVP